MQHKPKPDLRSPHETHNMYLLCAGARHMLGARGTEVQPLPLEADRRGEVGEQSLLVECHTALPHGAGKGGHWNRMGQQCGLAAP